MDRHYKIKVWKDRMVGAHPPKWCWEVMERNASMGKVIGCGTTFSERTSRDAATEVVEHRKASRSALPVSNFIY